MVKRDILKSKQRLKPISLAPLSVDEALWALLKTPPPKAGDPSTRKQKPKKKRADRPKR